MYPHGSENAWWGFDDCHQCWQPTNWPLFVFRTLEFVIRTLLGSKHTLHLNQYQLVVMSSERYKLQFYSQGHLSDMYTSSTCRMKFSKHTRNAEKLANGGAQMKKRGITTVEIRGVYGISTITTWSNLRTPSPKQVQRRSCSLYFVSILK